MEDKLQLTLQAQAAFENTLLAKENVVGVAVGLKESEGVKSEEMAVVVLVKEKVSVSDLPQSQVIPRHVDGVRTDVMAVGELWAQQQTPRDRYRPTIPGGVSLGHYLITAGTLGCIVRDRDTGERFILSNNHVIANSNEAQLEDVILQPGPADGGTNPADVVAKLARFTPLRYVEDPIPTPQPPTPQPPTPTPMPNGCLSMGVQALNALASMLGSSQRVIAASQAQQAASAQAAGIPMPAPVPAPVIVQSASVDNSYDAALGRLLDNAMFTDEIVNIGRVEGTMAPTLGQRVRKMGRTTGLTFGTITLLNATVNVGYTTSQGNRTARFTGQVITEAMSQGGDSGSLIVDASQNRAVGLLFAGSPLATIFSPIDVVLAGLNVII